MELSQEEKQLILETKEWISKNTKALNSCGYPIEYSYFQKVDAFFNYLLIDGPDKETKNKSHKLEMYGYDILKLALPSKDIWGDAILYIQNILHYLTARAYERNHGVIDPALKDELLNRPYTFPTLKKIQKLLNKYEKAIKQIPDNRFLIDMKIRELLILFEQDITIEREIKQEISKIELLLHDLIEVKDKKQKADNELEYAITLDFKQNGIWRKEDAFQVRKTDAGYELVIYIVDVTKGEHSASIHYRNMEDAYFLTLLYDDFLQEHNQLDSSFQEDKIVSAVAHKFYFDEQFQLQKRVPEVYLTNVFIEQNIYEEKLRHAEQTGKWGTILKDSYDTISIAKNLMEHAPTTVQYCKKGKLSQKLALFLNITMSEYFYHRNIPYIQTTGMLEQYGTVSCPKKDFSSYFNQLMEKKYLYYKDMDYNMIEKDFQLANDIQKQIEEYYVCNDKSVKTKNQKKERRK